MTPDVFAQLQDAGYAQLLTAWSLNGDTLVGTATPAFLARLRADDRFANGVFYGLHRDVGTDLADFRSYNGVLGPGSVQIVIDTNTLAVYADCDRFNPYEDVVRFLGHTGEVLGDGIRRLFRRKTHAV